MKSDFENIKKILVVKLCCLGDIVFVTPCINALRNRFPEAEITLLYSEWVKDIIPYLNGIDNSILFANPFEKSKLKLSFKALTLANKLRREKYDLALLTHRDDSLGLLLKTAGIKYRLGFEGTKHLTHKNSFQENIQESLRYLSILKKFNISHGDERVSLKRLHSKEHLKKLNGFSENEILIGIFPFGGINPGTNMVIKRWEYDKFTRLAERINKENIIKVIMFEGKDESEKINNHNEFFSVREVSIDNISMCDLLITNDTGPIHIADGFGIPTLGIYGPTDPALLGPLNYAKPIHQYIWKKPYCSPCHTPLNVRDKSNLKYWKGNEFICNTGTHECMKEITVDEVFEIVKSMIERSLN